MRKISIPGAVILVPRRSDSGERDALWAFCKKWWESALDIPIFEGHQEDGEWNPSSARNNAARLAGDWSIGIFCDSDTLMFPLQLVLGIKVALKNGRITFPFTSRIELWHSQTALLMAKNQFPKACFTHPIEGHPSGIIIVPRKLWDAVGGYDEGFVGWGCQDSDFLWRCEKLCGQVNRIHGNVYHLWHSRPKNAVPDSEIYLKNRLRLKTKHGERLPLT